MADKAAPSNVVDALKDVLANTSETLATYTGDLESDNTQQAKQFSIGNVVLRTPENDPNYKIWQEAAEQGDDKALIKTELSPETVSAAADLLLQSPEFKDYIGQYALSNDVSKNIQTIHDAINSQKNRSEDMLQEVDGDLLKGGEAYFIQQVLQGIAQGGMADDFFNEIRDKINSEFTPKEDAAPNTKPLNVESNNEPDALQKVAKLLEQREGKIVDDITPDEAWSEMKRMLASPEYQRAQTEDIGYDSVRGHPDPEIRAYETEMNKWRKQLPHPEFFEPEKPKNYEERRKQPKIDYDRRRKEGLTFEDAVEAGYKQHTPTEKKEPATTPTTSLFKLPIKNEVTTFIKSLETGYTPSLEPNILDNEGVKLSDIEKILQAQNTLDTSNETSLLTNSENTSTLITQSELPQKEDWTEVKTSDQLSEDILSNTEKTNIMMEGLINVMTAYMQTNNADQSMGNMPQVPQMPTQGGSGSMPAQTDLMKALNAPNLIADIRNKF